MQKSTIAALLVILVPIIIFTIAYKMSENVRNHVDNMSI
jgi:hypothetical protein